MELLEGPAAGLFRSHVSGGQDGQGPSGPGAAGPRFELAGACADPAAFVQQHCCTGYADAGEKVKFSKGTTTLAFVYKGGVIVSVDSRASQGKMARAGPEKGRGEGA
jgi:hypothetical protein